MTGAFVYTAFDSSPPNPTGVTTMTTTPDAIAAFKTQTESYWADSVKPVAWGLGIATCRSDGDETTILDVKFINLNGGPSKLNLGSLAAILLGCGVERYPETGYSVLLPEEIEAALEKLFPYTEEPEEDHPNIAALNELLELNSGHLLENYSRVPLVFWLNKLGAAPKDAVDAYFRLHLLSSRFVQPHGVSLDGVFGLLSNNAWTNLGPVLPDDVPRLERTLRGVSMLGHTVMVNSIDKFPRMTDYVRPSGVRIGDADRVRLGAHLARGTTVMHEGFVNFNAGTLGASMVEGRISAGVVVGNNTDIGGGASIMGTLSGGGKEVIRIGERCLLGANSGLGISLGNDCIVEAGLYITAGTKVLFTPPGFDDAELVKASVLSGRHNLRFWRNSTTGGVEVHYIGGQPVGLNKDLHAND